ncbi:MAG: hypothetical protein ACM31P_06065 [Actinomycetota bacterium]
MLFDRYEQDGLLFNTNFKESAGSLAAYRGELVLIPGEVADAQGRRKPPHALLKQAVALAEGESIKFLTGSLDELQHLGELAARYKGNLKSDTQAILFVVNIPKPLIIAIEGVNVIAIPLVEGIPWNELMETAGLEKGDFKGQSSAEKVVTLFKALDDFKPNYPSVSYAEALATTNNAKRDVRGAV